MKEQMKLSNAIREGAKLRPQGFKAYFDEENGVVCSCALGAAFEAVTGKLPRLGNANYIDEIVLPILNTNFSFFNTTARCACPVEDCNSEIFSPFNLIIHLNDTHNWTREQIAGCLKEKGF